MTRAHYPNPGAYVAWVRQMNERAAACGEVPDPEWRTTRPASWWVRNKLAALDARINLRAGGLPRWRRLDPLHQTELRRDQHALENIRRRVRVYQFATPEVRRRFGHLLSRYDD